MSPRLSDLLLRSQSDERLVSLARAGHDRAFDAIVQRYRPELSALARRLTSDGRAEDLLQQAFLNAFAALRSGAEVQHLRGWLYTIVRNAASKPPRPAELALDQVDVTGEPLEETVMRRARALAAMSELARLPERQRGALVATALGDRPHAEVALSMGISEQAVRQLVHRARATLRNVVTGITPWPVAKWLTTVSNAASAPEVAVGAGAVSSTGMAVKLGALLVATGALATGAAVVPVGQVHHGSAGRSPVTHTRGARAHAVPRAARFDSLVAVAPAAQAARRVPDTRSTHRASRVPDRRGGTVPRGHPGTGRSEGGPEAAGTSSEGSGSGDHSGHGDSSSVSESGDGGESTPSTSSATRTDSTGGQPDGGTSSSIEGGDSHSGSGSDGSISDNSREGR
jgi:RNA polymerase sigma factor (sigma-70 family)